MSGAGRDRGVAGRSGWGWRRAPRRVRAGFAGLPRPTRPQNAERALVDDGGVGRPALEGDVDVLGDAALGVVHSRGGGLHGWWGRGGVKGKSEE